MNKLWLVMGPNKRTFGTNGVNLFSKYEDAYNIKERVDAFHAPGAEVVEYTGSSEQNKVLKENTLYIDYKRIN
jgi:hypothetical protein